MRLIDIFKRPSYISLAALTALAIFLTLIFFANVSILSSVVFDSALSISTRVSVLVNIPYGYISEFSSRSLIAILFSLLFGINLAGIVYYVRLYKATAISAVATLGSGGIMSAIIGVGCISCGSLVAAIIVSIFGASSLAIILPLGGTEFALISILLLLISVTILDKKIKQAWL